MLFNTWTFAAFLGVVFLLHYVGRRAPWQVAVLTGASFVFYGWGNDASGFPHWRLVPLLAFSCAVNGLAARRLLTPGEPPARRRRILWAALAANLGVLGFFKYVPLLVQSLPAGAARAWLEPRVGHIPLPVGISFYTFQGISLVVDAWRGGVVEGLVPPPKGRSAGGFHARVWFFKAFFPQLVAGPIVKAGEFFNQIGPKRLADIDWNGAVRLLVTGFFFKMVVADNLREATAALAWPQFTGLPRANLVLLLYGFSFQIFADFAGYSSIARGLGKLFGYELPLNFDRPYLAASVTEFWRRWHLSLSSWLREYLYIPLGGNRLGPVRTYVNLFLVMFLGGLWHGAAWSYAVWGVAHGLLLAVERATGLGRQGGLQRTWTWSRLAGAVVTFHVVSILWLLFQLPDFRHVLAFGRCLVSNPPGVLPQYLFVTVLFGFPVILHHVLGGGVADWLGRRLGRGWAPVENAGHALMLFLTVVNPGAPGAFIYFQF